MRVSRTQATRALDAVRRRRRRAEVHRRRAVRPGGSAVASASPMTIELALRTIDEQPPIRIHLVEAAATRLATGDRPTPDAVAEMALRRATCDRLR